MILKYVAKPEDEGKTVKQIVDREFSPSNRLLSKLKNSGGIKVDGKQVTVRYVLTQGNTVTLEDAGKPNENIVPSPKELDVLYEDESILVVNKPFGMPTHPSQGHHDDTLANAVVYRYRDENFTFRAVTRLDADTTGVVLVARNALAAQRLTDSLLKDEIKKEYFAIVCGVPEKDEGIIDAPIARCTDSIIKRKISQEGKNACTYYKLEIICPDEIHSLVRARPITGRTHQIRLHLSHIGIPIYGDFLYSNSVDGVRAHLHCASLTFPHPVTKKMMVINAPLPQDMKSFL